MNVLGSCLIGEKSLLADARNPETSAAVDLGNGQPMNFCFFPSFQDSHRQFRNASHILERSLDAAGTAYLVLRV